MVKHREIAESVLLRPVGTLWALEGGKRSSQLVPLAISIKHFRSSKGDLPVSSAPSELGDIEQLLLLTDLCPHVGGLHFSTVTVREVENSYGAQHRAGIQ